MLIHVRARDLSLLGAIQRHLEKRVRAALGLYATRVASIVVGLSDINGPRGGADLRCAVTVEMLPRGSLRTEATGSDLLSTVGRALARARRGIRGAARRERGAPAARGSARYRGRGPEVIIAPGRSSFERGADRESLIRE